MRTVLASVQQALGSGVFDYTGVRDTLLGERFEVTTLIDLMPYATIGVGEKGTVVYVDNAGNIEVELDKVHPGLHQWHNCISIIPAGDTREIEEALKRIPANKATGGANVTCLRGSRVCPCRSS